MTRIVINACYGGFGLSQKAILLHREKKGLGLNDRTDIPRDDATLLQVVEELGRRANGKHAELTIVEIPDGIEWEIEDYGGFEWVAEKHRIWG